jgi:nucleolar pre-ribosomal-associated protein 1
VQHCTALALGKCLSKYSELLKVVRKVESVLEEDETVGSGRSGGMNSNVRRVDGFLTFKWSSLSLKKPGTMSMFNRLQVMWLRRIDRPTRCAQQCSPRARPVTVALSPVLSLRGRGGTFRCRENTAELIRRGWGDSVVSPTSGLDTLRRLHILRLLKESDQFVWSGKSGEFCTDSDATECWLTTTGTRSYINILLSAYVSTGVVAVRDVIGALLRRLLSESILFEHDPEEVYFWLSSLPIGTRPKGTGAPDETPLLDEQTAVISFLDDCIQLGLKMPYGYIEEVTVLSRGSP